MAITDKIDINFQVLNTYDPYYLSIADYSVWGQIVNRPVIIEIILPGESKPIVKYFKQNQINAFNSVNLELNCISDCGDVHKLELPDGIYSLTVKGSPDSYNFSRKHLRTTLLELNRDEVLVNSVNTNKNINKDLLQSIVEFDFILEAAKSNLRLNNICRAQELYREAEDLINSVKNCKECVGV